MLEIFNAAGLAVLGVAVAFVAGWLARGRKIPPPPAKRPLGVGVVTGKTAAGLLDVTMAELGRLVAEGKIRPMPSGLAVSDIHAILAERQLSGASLFPIT